MLIPINEPDEFRSAPPLFPGFIAASVWIKSSYISPWIILPLPLAETIPAVTVWLKFAEKGLPTAITSSPTLNSSESPNRI